MKTLRGWLAGLLLVAAAPLAAQPEAPTAVAEPPAPAISLLSFGPGEVYWQRFGHNALLVQDAGGSRVYNYGMFDFQQENFFLNFARGHMTYRLDVQSLPQTLRSYQAESRWVYQQQLNLDAAQARELAAFLAWNAQPENADYRYDYFLSNCSTRVRDALDAVLDGALRRQLEPQQASTSYRFEATRLMAPIPALMAGMDLVMGPAGDPPINLWQQSFVPMVLMDAVRDLKIEDARGERPLVLREGWVLQSERYPEPSQPLALWWPFGLAGLLLALLLVALDAARNVTAARWSFALLASLSMLVAGLGGLVLAAVWGLTEHWVMWRNANLLLFSPLCLLLLPVFMLSARRGWRAPRWASLLSRLLLAGAVLALLLWLSPGPQRNLAWIALLLPLHAAIAWSLRRR